MRYFLILLVAGMLSSCADTTPHWDRRFGLDTRTTLALQIADPAAARNTDPVAGMDGRSAHAAYDRYQKSSGEQKQLSVLNGAAK